MKKVVLINENTFLPLRTGSSQNHLRRVVLSNESTFSRLETEVVKITSGRVELGWCSDIFI